MSKFMFYFFPLSGLLLMAALMYPQETALTNILLSAPLHVFYLWFFAGLLFAMFRTDVLWTRLGFSLLLSVPVITLLLRLPAPL